MASAYFILCIVGTLFGCGTALPRTKIVGGEPAMQGQIPYILSLQIDGNHHCGASIIQVQGLTLAISAAHCTKWIEEEQDPNRFNVTVVAGEITLSEQSGAEQTRRVTRIVNHDFDEMKITNDICLLFLDSPFELNNNTNVIELPAQENTTSGNIRVSGWGLLSEGGEQSDDLMTTQLPVVNDETCAKAYAESGIEIVDAFMCAGFLGVGGTGSCQQDSGGPAVKDGKLVGIVSFGIGCARAEFPGVFTEVAYFLDWIGDQVATYLREQ